MRRREFVTLVGGAIAAWPLEARARQPPMPLVGFLNAGSAQDHARSLSAFMRGLGQTGDVDGQNVQIEYRWAEYRNNRLLAMAADLAKRDVAVIAATTTLAALAANMLARELR